MVKKKTNGKASSKDATTTEKRETQKKKSDNIVIMPLDQHQDLIVPFLMDFLDVPTVVSLGSTSKKNQEHSTKDSGICS
jgi:hypothetical protein